jgi:hypothetical protein
VLVLYGWTLIKIVRIYNLEKLKTINNKNYMKIMTKDFVSKNFLKISKEMTTVIIV